VGLRTAPLPSGNRITPPSDQTSIWRSVAMSSRTTTPQASSHHERAIGRRVITRIQARAGRMTLEARLARLQRCKATHFLRQDVEQSWLRQTNWSPRTAKALIASAERLLVVNQAEKSKNAMRSCWTWRPTT